jgi:hypothetical protein
MNKFKSKPVKVDALVDIELRKEYKKYCIDNDFTISTRIRQLITKDLRGEIKD